MPVRYEPAECRSRFTLEKGRYEYSYVEKGGDTVQEGPPFVMFTLRKHFEGDFKRLPQITIVQTKLSKKGKPTRKKARIEFPFREKLMAAPVDDWKRSGIEVSLMAPGAIMNLHNPMDWTEIVIRCD